MDRRRLLASLAPAVWALAGCTTPEAGATTTTTPAEPEYDAHVFDHAGLDRAVLEGGIAFRDDVERVRYAALLTDSERFRMDLLRIAVDNESEYGTDDVTVETALVRVARDGATPERAVVTTAEGVSVPTGE